jgi:glucose/arabinose dehydrogenase
MAFYAAQTFPVAAQAVYRRAEGDVADCSEGDGNKVTKRILEARGKRIRDVRVGPDGYLYVLTDESNGELLR